MNFSNIALRGSKPKTSRERGLKHNSRMESGGLDEVEKAIKQLIMTEPTCTPWRQSEVERAGSRDGTRMATLEFYWAHRHRCPLSSESWQNRSISSSKGLP